MLRIFPLLILFVLFSSCSSDPGGVVNPKEPLPEYTPDRTVLLYIVGDNNLWSYAERNIQAIMEGMSTSNSTLNMLVYQDDNSYTGDVPNKPTLWKIESKDGEVKRIPVFTYDEQNSVDKEIMSGVIREAYARFPAQEKGIIFWAHGSGWLPKPETKGGPALLAFGPDKDQYIDIWELREILEMTDIVFDFLMFDACNMASAEVAYELKDVAKHQILSPTEIMGAGYPYQYMVPVFAQTELDLEGICQAYMKYYHGEPKTGRDGSISLIKSSELDSLATLYTQFLEKYGSLINYQDIRSLQQFGRSSMNMNNLFFDLQSVVSHYMDKEDLSIMSQQISKAVPYEDHTPMFINLVLAQSSGLAVYIPSFNPDRRYLEAFGKTRWAQRTNQN